MTGTLRPVHGTGTENESKPDEGSKALLGKKNKKQKKKDVLRYFRFVWLVFAGSQASRHTAEPIKSADHLIWELLSRPRHEDEPHFSLSRLFRSLTRGKMEEWKRCQQGREVQVYRQNPNSYTFFG